MNCDFIARWYRWLEYLAFGKALERRRREYLDEAANAGSVLILGDGDGRFTAELLRRSAALIDSVDLSPRMLSLAQGRIREHKPNGTRLRFHQGDARTMKLPPKKYDLIVSHFFLDCFTPDELPVLIARISHAAGPQARWLISEFGVPSTGIRRVAGAFLIKVMYWFFRALTGLKARRLPDYSTSLSLHGFRRVRHRSTADGFLVSELWERS